MCHYDSDWTKCIFREIQKWPILIRSMPAQIFQRKVFEREYNEIHETGILDNNTIP